MQGRGRGTISPRAGWTAHREVYPPSRPPLPQVSILLPMLHPAPDGTPDDRAIVPPAADPSRLDPWPAAPPQLDSPVEAWARRGSPRAPGHLSTGLRSPLSWMVYLATALALGLLLRPYWREALLAFAATALAAAAWLLLAPPRRRRPDDPALLDRIDAMSGLEFEAWIVERLRGAGHPVRNVRDSGDFGVDIVTWMQGLAIGLQPKRYQGRVGNDAIQQVLAGCDYHGCQVAVVLTQSSFTAPAREQAARARHPVLLIERPQLLSFVDILAFAAADAGLRQRLLQRRSLALRGQDRPADEASTQSLGQEAAEDLVAHGQAPGAEPQAPAVALDQAPAL